MPGAFGRNPDAVFIVLFRHSCPAGSCVVFLFLFCRCLIFRHTADCCFPCQHGQLIGIRSVDNFGFCGLDFGALVFLQRNKQVLRLPCGNFYLLFGRKIRRRIRVRCGFGDFESRRQRFVGDKVVFVVFFAVVFIGNAGDNKAFLFLRNLRGENVLRFGSRLGFFFPRNRNVRLRQNRFRLLGNGGHFLLPGPFFVGADNLNFGLNDFIAERNRVFNRLL